MLDTIGSPPPEAWLRAAATVDHAVRGKAPLLAPPLVAPWHPGPRLHATPSGPWLVTPLELDPLRQADGGYPMPRRVRAELRAVVATGVDFDHLVVAHEVDPSGPVKALAGAIAPGGLACDAAATRVLVGPLPASRSTRRVGAAVAGGIRAAVVGLQAAGMVAAAPLALPFALGLDPVIYGVQHVGKHAAGALALHYALAEWVWE